MSYQPAVQLDDTLRLRAGPAVSWGAIIAGAAAAISLSILLLTLGSGLGFAAISPWANRGASAASVVISGAIWLIVTQWISAAVGGYLAGRLRHRWLATHQHEVFFRDTAHGLVTWSVATLVVVFAVSSSLSALGGGVARAGSAAAGAGAKGGMELAHAQMSPPGLGAGPGGEEHMYGTDKLFRKVPAPANAMAAMAPMNGGVASGSDSGNYRMEAAHIAARAASTGDISDEDRSYLVSLVAAKAGVSADEAQRRVDAFVADVKDAVTRAKAAADEARKAAAQAAIYTALAMLIGAFIASVSAAIGGRLRDEHL
jgi:hypothetical protein